MTRRFLCTALLLSLLAAAMLLFACGSAGQSEPDLQTALHTVTDVTTDVTDTTAPAETTVSRTTAVTTEADKTVETCGGHGGGPDRIPAPRLCRRHGRPE